MHAGQGRGTVLLPADLRLRLVAGVACLLLVAALHGPGAAGMALMAVLLLIWAGRLAVPWRRLWHLEAFLVLLALTLPFTVPGQVLFTLGPFSASLEGLARTATIAAKVAASVLLMAALFLGVAPERLGAALQALGLPAPLLRIFLGLVRYLGLIRAEMARLQEAMRVRSFRPRSNLHTWRTYGWLIGMMVLRALARADRVAEAMRLRGHEGRLPHLPFPPPPRADRLAALALPLPFVLILLSERL